MRRTISCVGAAILGVGALAGCHAARPAPAASMGVFSATPAPIVLGAGDALGHAVYVNDVILALSRTHDESRVTAVDDLFVPIPE